MNEEITFPPRAPTLKLARPSAEKWAATLAEERRRLQEDQEALRERESNLREYEARLRELQADLDAARASGAGSQAPMSTGSRAPHPQFHRPTSHSPFTDDTGLQAAWEKLHRAHEIFEAEQSHLRDDRIAVSELAVAVKRREEAVAARELRLAEREALVAAAIPQVITNAASSEPSAVSKLTRAPFNLARSVFGGKG
jgi:DNA repair exonuclease SbcCD ATPase subunit